MVGSWLFVCNLDELLAEVLPGEEAPQGVRGILEPLDHINLVPDLSLTSPAGERTDRLMDTVVGEVLLRLGR